MTTVAQPEYRPAAAAYPQLCDAQGHRLAVLDRAFSVIVTEVLVTPDGEGQETLTFQLPADDPKWPLVDNERHVRVAGSEYVIRQVKDGWDSMQSMASAQVAQSRWQSDQSAQGGASMVLCQVYAEALWYDLATADPITSLALTQVSPHVAINTVLSGTGWRFGGSDIHRPNNFSVGQPTTPLAALRLIQQTWGGELQFDSVNRTVSLWRQRGGACPVVYAYRHNLAGNTRTLDTETFATRAWIFGAGNLTIAQVNGGKPYLEDYSFFDERGWPREVRSVTVVNDQLTDPAQLLQWGLDQVTGLSKPKPTYELVVAQLPQDPVPGVGDSVQVWDSQLQLRTSPRVVRRDYDVLQPYNTQLQLANTLPALPTAKSATVGGAPVPVMSNGSVVMGASGQAYSTAPQGTSPNVTLDQTGVWATHPDGSTAFFLSAVTGILTAQAVLTPGSNVPAPVITGQIVTVQIADDAIVTTKISDGSVETPKLAANSVTTAKILAGAVTSNQIASQTILAGNIAAATIVGGNIASATITADKMSVGSLSAITANLGTINAGTINSVTINSASINIGSVAINPTIGMRANCSGAFPTPGDATGLQFYNPSSGRVEGACSSYGYNGVYLLSNISGGTTAWLNLSDSALRVSLNSGSQMIFNSSGNLSIPGTLSQGSDLRFKRDVRPVGGTLADLRRLRGVRYRSQREVGSDRLGVVAQELAEVFPEAVGRQGAPADSTDGTAPEVLTVEPMALIAVLVEAVKDLACQVEELRDAEAIGHPLATVESDPDA